jgi:hypothetical protein
VYPNESVTRDRIGTAASPHPLEAALEQWFSFATGRHTWISVRGATLRGLVSARQRGTKAAWEVDCLIDATDGDPDVLINLLEKVTTDAAKAGAEKVFVRVPVESDVQRTLASAGFSSYMRDRLVMAEGVLSTSADPHRDEFRRWAKPDAYPAFQLYNRWAPEPVRRIEAMTFREWQAARERVAPARGAVQRVIERDGRMAGWLRTWASGDTGRFDIMTDPSQPAVLDLVIDHALARFSEQSTLLTLVPEFAAGLIERLEGRGFCARDEYAVFACRTAQPARVAEPELAPAVTT